MGTAIESTDYVLLMEPQILNQYTQINYLIDALDQLCMQAMMRRPPPSGMTIHLYPIRGCQVELMFLFSFQVQPMVSLTAKRTIQLYNLRPHQFLLLLYWKEVCL